MDTSLSVPIGVRPFRWSISATAIGEPQMSVWWICHTPLGGLYLTLPFHVGLFR
jgi:hypothetical protein